jgi:hypothetical protein
MPRPQFSIRTLLWLTLVVAAFLGGMLFERKRLDREELELELRRQEAIYAQFVRAEKRQRQLRLRELKVPPNRTTIENDQD